MIIGPNQPLPGTVVRMRGVDVIGAFEKAVEMLQDAKAKFRPTFVLTMTPGALCVWSLLSCAIDEQGALLYFSLCLCVDECLHVCACNGVLGDHFTAFEGTGTNLYLHSPLPLF